MAGHKLIIGCNFNQFESNTPSFIPNTYLLIDKIDEKRSEGSVQLAKQPIQTGDTITDHMFRNPDTYTVSGSFSLNGSNWSDDSYDFIQKGDRLTNIQAVFKRIKDEGLLCTLMSINEEEMENIGTHFNNAWSENALVDTSVRFEVHKNMCLHKISWVELENTLKFNFSFQEVIMIESQEYEDLLEADRLDLGLPYVANPSASSLGTVLSEIGGLQQTVLQTLYDRGYIEQNWLKQFVDDILLGALGFIQAAVVGAVVAVAVAVGLSVAVSAVTGVLTTLGIVSASTAAIFPVGTVVAAVAAVAALITTGIIAAINISHWAEQRRKEAYAFKLVDGDALEVDENRLLNLLADVEMSVNQITSNVSVYQITENKPQVVTLNIAGVYYWVEFYQENITEDDIWRAKVTLAGTDGQAPTHMLKDKWCPVSTITELNRNVNLWFRDETLQYEVYLVNPSLSDEFNAGEEDIHEVRKRLTSYSIWVSKGNIKNNIDNLQNAIMKAIDNAGFIE